MNTFLLISMFLLVIVGPLVVGIALLVLARRFRRDWAKVTAGISGSIFLLIFLFYLFAAGPYLWALHLEARWRPADPKTRTHLESMLYLYTKSDILPEQSSWGRNHHLQSGEQMTRYSLMGSPLDVVYTNSDAIVAIYTSYE
jgi:hypothetical protein